MRSVPKGRLNFRAVQISEWGGTFVIALSGTLDLWAVGRKSDWGSKLCKVPRRRRGRAKNEALFPGRVPHVRPSVHGPKMTGRSPLPTLLLIAETAVNSKSPCTWSE